MSFILITYKVIAVTGITVSTIIATQLRHIANKCSASVITFVCSMAAVGDDAGPPAVMTTQLPRLS